MKRNMSLILQISAVFIGTIVGAGLASGQEIKQFFTVYSFKGFIGIVVCLFIYIIVGYVVIDLSIQYSLKSYDSLIRLVSPGILGKVIDIITSIFLISSSGIILAGAGALIHQYFNISKWFGIILMVLISLYTLLKNTKGLIEINSFIVPCLIVIIITIFIFYMFFSKNSSIQLVQRISPIKKHWLISSLLYSSFNILCCSGVLAPLSAEINDKRTLVLGVSIGALVLTILCFIINFLLLLNIPYIFNYEIPLLYIASYLGKALKVMLFCIIFLEMFSTEVSDIFSVSKTLEQKFKIPYKKSVFIILSAAIPISQVGFVNLITYLYPAFGFISMIFIVQCTIFYIKNKLFVKANK